MAGSGQAAGARLPLHSVIAFALASLPISALTVAIAVYLPRHFASHIGISLAAVGAIFATVRLLDVAVDLALGLAMDRTETRFGRYRAWIALGVPVLVAAVAGLFFAPQGIGIVYLIFWLLILYLGTSIIRLSHAAWAATLAPSYDERARIFAAITAVGVIGTMLLLATPIAMRAFGPVSDGAAVQAMGWLLIVITPPAIGLVIWRTPERINRDVQGLKFRWRDYWDLVRDPSMGRIIAADLLLTLGPGWMSALYLFYFKDALGFSTDQASLLLGVYILAGLAGAPLMGRLATRISKHRAVIVATSGYSLILMCVPFVPTGSLAIAIAPMFFAGFFAAGFEVLTRAMTADVSDEMRLQQGKERAGLLFAITTLTSKISSAFSIWLTFTVLEAIGYQAREGAVNTPEAIQGLEYAYIIGPIVFVMLGGACFLGYKLDAARHAQIRRDLEARDALYMDAPVIETLSDPAVSAPLPQGRPPA